MARGLKFGLSLYIQNLCKLAVKVLSSQCICTGSLEDSLLNVFKVLKSAGSYILRSDYSSQFLVIFFDPLLYFPYPSSLIDCFQNQTFDLVVEPLIDNIAVYKFRLLVAILFPFLYPATKVWRGIMLYLSVSVCPSVRPSVRTISDR